MAATGDEILRRIRSMPGLTLDPPTLTPEEEEQARRIEEFLTEMHQHLRDQESDFGRAIRDADLYFEPSAPPEPRPIFEVGDIVTRTGDDRHEVVEADDPDCIMVRCIEADYMKAGETEFNLARRYSLVDVGPRLSVPSPGCAVCELVGFDCGGCAAPSDGPRCP